MRKASAFILCSSSALAVVAFVIGYGFGAGVFVDDESRHRKMLLRANQGNTEVSNTLGILYAERQLEDTTTAELVQLALRNNQDSTTPWDEVFGTILELAWIRGEIDQDQWTIFIDGAVDPMVYAAVYRPVHEEISLHMRCDNGRAGIGAYYPISSRVIITKVTACEYELSIANLPPIEFVVGDSRYFRFCDEGESITVPTIHLPSDTDCKTVEITFNIELFSGRPQQGVEIHEYLANQVPLYRKTTIHSHLIDGITSD